MRRAVLLLAIADCSGRGAEPRPPPPQPGDAMRARTLGDHVVLVTAAAGATRLRPDDGRVVAEIGGAWQEESFRNDDLPPPVLRLVDVGADRAIDTTMG